MQGRQKVREARAGRRIQMTDDCTIRNVRCDVMLTQDRLRHIDHGGDEDSEDAYQRQQGRTEFENSQHVTHMLTKLLRGMRPDQIL